MAIGKLLVSGLLAGQFQHAKDVAEARVASAAIRMATLMVVALFALIALVFASLAAFFWLNQTWESHIAALWVAGGLLAIAFLAMLIGNGRARARDLRIGASPASRATGGSAAPAAALGAGAGAGAKALSDGAENLRATALDKGYEIGSKVNTTISSHPYKSLGTALAVGVAVAMLSRRRPPPPPRC